MIPRLKEKYQKHIGRRTSNEVEPEKPKRRS
jgi:hypothetical protein